MLLNERSKTIIVPPPRMPPICPRSGEIWPIPGKMWPFPSHCRSNLFELGSIWVRFGRFRASISGPIGLYAKHLRFRSGTLIEQRNVNGTQHVFHQCARSLLPVLPPSGPPIFAVANRCVSIATPCTDHSATGESEHSGFGQKANKRTWLEEAHFARRSVGKTRFQENDQTRNCLKLFFAMFQMLGSFRESRNSALGDREGHSEIDQLA